MLRPPGSKSLTNRALILAALASGTSTLDGILFSDDSQVMLDALHALGLSLQIDPPQHRVTLTGRPDFQSPPAAPRIDLFTGNSGTSTRFLAAMCATFPGLVVRLDGIARMRQRPIGDLASVLQQLGACIQYELAEGYPPLVITGADLAGGEVTMRADASSQFVSAMLMAGPRMARGLTVRFDGPVVSKPYIVMTLDLMRRFGVAGTIAPDWSNLSVPHGTYRAIAYPIEPDASNASYFLAAAAVVPGSRCTIAGLGRSSVQGDVGVADVLHRMGAGLVFGADFITVMGPPPAQPLHGIDIDLNAMPDMAQTLAVVALFAQGPTTLRNIGNLRVKETDRLAALQNELTKFGATVRIDGDDLTIIPPATLAAPTASIDTYDDHRMAMSFAVAGLRLPGVILNDPGCVRKTFPDFFEYLGGLSRS